MEPASAVEKTSFFLNLSSSNPNDLTYPCVGIEVLLNKVKFYVSSTVCKFEGLFETLLNASH